MKGRIPKDSSVRQRRNKTAGSAKFTDEAKKRRRAPRLPGRQDDKQWHPLTRAWWRDLWHSPMADEFLRSDHHALFRLALLIDSFWLEPTKDLASEIRLEQQAFGLTPLDRRRLEWTVERLDAEKPPKRAMQRPPADAADPRALLAVGSGDGEDTDEAAEDGEDPEDEAAEDAVAEGGEV